jgi:UDP-N-acetylglucosamine 2-epimerase (non-hydrolysing)
MLSKVPFVLWTWPEGVKLSPVRVHLRWQPGEFVVRICVNAQYHQLVDEAFNSLNACRVYDLDVRSRDDTQSEWTSSLIMRLKSMLERERPHPVMDQVNTAATLFAACWRRETGRSPGEETNPI